MYVMKKDGQNYVYVSGGLNYVSNVSIEATSAITIYMPDGTLLTNASVTVNDVVYTTDASGKVYLTGAYDKSEVFNIVYATNYRGSVKTTYGTDGTVQLIQLFLLTVTATGFTYSNNFTVTTTIEGVSTVGSLSQYLTVGTSVTVKIAGYTSSNGDRYYGSYVIFDGTSTGATSYTFTMDADHIITFTNGKYEAFSGGT